VSRGPGFDVDAAVLVEVGGEQDLLARVHPEGDVVQPAGRPEVVLGVDHLVPLYRGGRPHPRLLGFVGVLLLDDAHPETVPHRQTAAADVAGEQVDVLEARDADALADAPLWLVLHRGT